MRLGGGGGGNDMNPLSGGGGLKQKKSNLALFENCVVARKIKDRNFEVLKITQFSRQK